MTKQTDKCNIPSSLNKAAFISLMHDSQVNGTAKVV
jgi:hypothetical protein